MAGLINFEDEQEVKQFLEKLGVEYSYQCYREKDPEGCQRLADYLEGSQAQLRGEWPWRELL
uniref:Cytochrome c oxidase assembly factor 7 n=1 Tax=Sinocyclocheilus grahami TaxID=75366 RepID=A0A672K5V0_SINGR